jgi:GTP-binding protein
MAFVDKVTVSVKAGDGGNGRVSMRHEKFIDRGGPDGGDGGHGADVVLVASRNQNTLAKFRFQKEIIAKPGQAGDKRRKHGRSAPHLLVQVPVGTIAMTPEGEIVADLTTDGQTAIIAKGGKGGFGNAHFTSSVRQAPTFAEKGEPGEEFDRVLELKMIADVGLIGMPNAGKSTFLARTSNARPEIADYPFTTLKPNLGMVEIDKTDTLLVADIPGLIEGAAEGKGLGHEFLRHVERTAVLVHMIDAYQNDITGTYKTIQKELKDYSSELASRPQVVAINKTEGLDAEMIADLEKQLATVVPKSTKIFAISAVSGNGIQPLLYKVNEIVQKQRKEVTEVLEEIDAHPILKLTNDEDAWQVTKQADAFYVTGSKIELFAARTDFENEEGIRRLRDIMRRQGIIHELNRQGLKHGDDIMFGRFGPITY